MVPCWRRYITEAGHWGFISSPHLRFALFAAEDVISQPPALSGCCHASPLFLRTIRQMSFHNLVLAMGFCHSPRKGTHTLPMKHSHTHLCQQASAFLIFHLSDYFFYQFESLIHSLLLSFYFDVHFVLHLVSGSSTYTFFLKYPHLSFFSFFIPLLYFLIQDVPGSARFSLSSNLEISLLFSKSSGFSFEENTK